MCRDCGARIPPGHPRCPLCGKVAPAEAPAPDTAADLVQEKAAIAREVFADVAGKERRSRGLRFAEGLLLALAMPAMIPGLLALVLMVKRWGHIPLTLVLPIGFIFLMGSYAGPSDPESDWAATADIFFWMMHVAFLATTVLFVLRAARGRAKEGILLGYSGLTVLLMTLGGLFLYVNGIQIVRQLRAPRFSRAVPEAVESMNPNKAARVTGFAHAALENARVDWSRAVWRIDGGGADVFTPTVEKAPEEMTVDELLARHESLLGANVALKTGSSGACVWIPEKGEKSNRQRVFQRVGGMPPSVVYIASPVREVREKTRWEEMFLPNRFSGVASLIPTDLLESPQRFDIRGRKRGQAIGVALLQDVANDVRKLCGPVEGTDDQLWVQCAGMERPPDGTPLQGIVETPGGGAGRSLAACRVRAGGKASDAVPRVLVMTTPAAFREDRGLPAAPAPSEGIPASRWLWTGAGALLVGAGLFLALRE